MSEHSEQIVTEELVEYVADLVGQRYKRHEIRTHLKEELGVEPSHATLDKLITQARDKMKGRASATKDEHRQNAIEFYERIIANPDSRTKDKLAAQAQLNEILGLNAKQSITIETPESIAQNAKEILRQMNEADA